MRPRFYAGIDGPRHEPMAPGVSEPGCEWWIIFSGFFVAMAGFRIRAAFYLLVFNEQSAFRAVPGISAAPERSHRNGEFPSVQPEDRPGAHAFRSTVSTIQSRGRAVQP